MTKQLAEQKIKIEQMEKWHVPELENEIKL